MFGTARSAFTADDWLREIHPDDRDVQGKVVDFEWEYANPAAHRLLHSDTGDLVGQRLLERLPANRDHPALFPRYARVVNGEEAANDVELHYAAGGDLRMESTPGAGTTVTIVLPRAAGALRMPKFKAVLMVEDNEAAGEFAASLLEELGYRARTATSATQAMELLQAGETFDAVFSDVVLPGGMSGNQLAVALRRQFPRIAVVLATGYGGQAAATSPPAGVETLPKPYQLAELAAALERALSRAEPHGTAPA